MFDFIKDNPITFLLIFLAIVARTIFFKAIGVIFYIILGFIILLFVLGLVFRFKIRRIQKNMEDQMGQNGQGSYGNYGSFFGGQSRRARTEQQDNEGDVKIFQQKGSSEKKVAKDVGDYVDFEEVKEKN